MKCDKVSLKSKETHRLFRRARIRGGGLGQVIRVGHMVREGLVDNASV